MTIPELRAQIWTVAAGDTDRIERAKKAIRFEPTEAHYRQLLAHLTAHTPRKKAKKREPIDPAIKARYDKAFKDYQSQFKGWTKDKHTMDAKYPDVRTAGGLTSFICKYIMWTGGRATRVSSSGRWADGKWIPSTTRKGSADVSSTINGKSVMWEIKIGKDKPSPAQLKEQDRERKAGGMYEFVKTPEDFFTIYDSIVVQKALF